MASNDPNETKEEEKEEDVGAVLAQRQADELNQAERRKLKAFERAGQAADQKIRGESSLGLPPMISRRDQDDVSEVTLESSASLFRGSLYPNTDTPSDEDPLPTIAETWDTTGVPPCRGEPSKRHGRVEESTCEAQELEVGIAKLIRARMDDEVTPLESGSTFASSTLTGGSTAAAPEARRQVSRPGAYAQAPGTDMQRMAEVRSSVLGVVARIRAASEHLRRSRARQPNNGTIIASTRRHGDSEGLSVADLVEDADSRALTVATSVDLEASLARKQETETFKCAVIISVLLVAIVPLILLLSYVPSWGAKNAILSPPTTSQAAAPSQSPSSFMQGRVLSLLPDATLMALKDESSPQSKAYRWLLDGTEYLPHLTDNRILQRYALATLYFATEGKDWVRQEGWLNHSVHECFWESKQYQNQDEQGFFLSLGRPGEASTLCGLHPAAFAKQGVLEDVNSHVMHLWKPQNNLQGSLPPELSLLSTLESIHLDVNSVGNMIPSEIGQLSLLKAISMNDCGLSGTIPGFLMGLTDLTAFHFGSNSLTGTIPPELGHFSQLRSLLLLGNSLTGTLPTGLGNLTLLKKLFLDTNPITGTIPTEFGLMQEVDFLDLREMKLIGTIPSQIGNMAAMYILLLHSNSLTGTIPTEIGMLQSVQAMALAKNNLVGGIPSQMGLLYDATHLWIDTNELTGTVPSEMTNLLANGTLERFWLQGNEFSGSIPRELCSLEEQLVFDCNGQLCGCDCECSSK